VIFLRAYKTELDLNNKQRTSLTKHAGTARYAYNWGLARKIEEFKAGRKMPTAIDLHRELNALKKTDFPWMYEVSKCAPQESLRNLDKAFSNFFRRVKEKKAYKFSGKVGFPKFKSKKRGLGSFRLTGTIRIAPINAVVLGAMRSTTPSTSLSPQRIKLPRLGWLRLKESGYLPDRRFFTSDNQTDGIKILSATVSEHAGHWFVSLQVEQEIEVEKAQGEPCGVDLGIKSLAVCSDGREIENPKALRKSLKKLRRAQRELSRRKKGGKKREKSRRKVAKLHYRIANIRKDAIHKATSSIVAKNKPQEQRPSVVVIEDLSVENLLKNHNLARAISDVGFGEFRRQLTYKTMWNGVSLLVADRFFPSSKLCSACGAINDKLTLSMREWTCGCGARHDRDRNAAQNLSRLVPIKSE